jgi:thymidylate synthase (FAD)
MKITLISSSTLVPARGAIEGPPWAINKWLPEDGRRGDDEWSPDFADDADMITEFAGRACYESWDRPNPNTAHNADYVRNILGQQHESVLEHSSLTFYVEEVSRSMTLELVRHRHLSYSQRSQRYVNESLSDFVIPGDLSDRQRDPYIARLIEELKDHHKSAANLYGEIVEALMDTCVDERGELYPKLGIKQARGAARAALLESTHTNIVVTGNLRAWRDMLKKRWHVAAEREIREFAGLILADIRSIAPNSVQDIPSEPYGTE